MAHEGAVRIERDVAERVDAELQIHGASESVE